MRDQAPQVISTSRYPQNNSVPRPPHGHPGPVRREPLSRTGSFIVGGFACNGFTDDLVEAPAAAAGASTPHNGWVGHADYTVNFDDRLYRNYVRGRRIDPATMTAWVAEFVRHAPTGRPLRVLDLGSGTGRFSPALADAFGGPVYGVEPSERMRELAIRTAAHPAVRYLAGRGEEIPLADAHCDLALLFFSLHHMSDRMAALREVARVVRPGGIVLIRTQLADRMPEMHWYRYFPSVRAADIAMFPTTAEIRELAGATGFREPVLTSLPPEPRRTLRESYERIRLRAVSTFEHIPEQEFSTGLASFAADVAERGDTLVSYPRGDMLVLHRE